MLNLPVAFKNGSKIRERVCRGNQKGEGEGAQHFPLLHVCAYFFVDFVPDYTMRLLTGRSKSRLQIAD